MKFILSFVVLLTTQMSFAASTLECSFHTTTADTFPEIKSIVKTQPLEKSEFIIVTEGELLGSTMVFEDSLTNFKIKVSANVYNDEKDLSVEVIDLKSKTISRSRGSVSVNGESMRTDHSDFHFSEAIAFNCSIKE